MSRQWSVISSQVQFVKFIKRKVHKVKPSRALKTLETFIFLLNRAFPSLGRVALSAASPNCIPSYPLLSLTQRRNLHSRVQMKTNEIRVIANAKSIHTTILIFIRYKYKIATVKKILLITFSFSLYASSLLYAQSWSTVSSGVNGPVYAMAVYDSTLYVGGSFDSAGGVPVNNIAKWDGKTWSALGTGVRYKIGGVYSSASVSALCVFNGLLYVSGGFDFAGTDSVNGFAAYDGSTWNAIKGNHGGGFSSMVANDSLMYVAGGRSVSIFNGTSFVNGQCFLCVDEVFCNEQIAYCHNLAIYDNSVAIGGNFLDTNNLGGIAMPNSYYPFTGPDISLGLLGPGKSWSILNHNDANYSLLADSNLLYVGLNNTVSVYNGSYWTQIGGNLLDASGNGYVYSLCKYNGNIIAGGEFTGIGSASANNIMELNNGNWATMGTGIKCDSVSFGGYAEESHVAVMVVYNDTLYVAGLFNNAGELPANNIARWGNAVSGVKQVEEPTFTTAVFPNPNNGVFYCTVQNNMPGCQIVVYNMLGQQISDVALNNSKTEINIQGQASGIYVYRILSGTGSTLSSGKFIVL